jgi:hypothetical protein
MLANLPVFIMATVMIDRKKKLPLHAVWQLRCH